MKIRIILVYFFLLSAAVLQSARAQEVAEVQQSLITKFTAMWNGESGTWGWTLFEKLRDSLPGKAVVIAAHVADSYLQNQISLDWEANMGSADVPKFYLNDELQDVNAANASAAFQAIRNEVEDNYQSPPLAGVGLETAWNGLEIDLKTKVRFFQSGSGAFYLGLYLVEHHVMAAQAGFSGWVPHNGLLRASVTSAPFGNLLAAGIVDAGAEFSKTYTFSTGAYNLDNLDVVGVIWKKEGNVYKFVNAWSIDAKPLASSVLHYPAESQIKAVLRPNVLSGGEGLLVLHLARTEELSIDVFGADGRQAGRAFEGRLPAGRHEIPFDSEGIGPAGWYAVRVVTGMGERVVLPFFLK